MHQANRPFRFGVQMRMNDDWVSQARRAEAFGYDIFLMPDHFGRQFAIGPALATVAAATSKIRIGTLVLQNDLRHPALVAMDAATLDVLSGGRFELGIGAGGSYLPDFEWTGIAFDPPGFRLRRLAESVTVLKGLFAEGPFSFKGEFFTITEFDAMPKPVQQPHLPLLIAGGGKKSLTLAANHADIVGLLPQQLRQGGDYAMDESSLEAYAAKSAFVVEQAGERAKDIEFNILVQMLIVTDDPESEIARLKAESADNYTDAWFASPMVYVGTASEIVTKMRYVRQTTGASYFALFEPMMEPFAPILAELKRG
jgi:probable F420-dependent oxidoreductase